MDKYERAFAALESRMDGMNNEELKAWLIDCGFKFEDSTGMQAKQRRVVSHAVKPIARKLSKPTPKAMACTL